MWFCTLFNLSTKCVTYSQITGILFALLNNKIKCVKKDFEYRFGFSDLEVHSTAAA